MLEVGKYLALVVATLIGFLLGQALGPINSLPSVVEVNEHFLDVMRNHTLFLGLSAALTASILNLLLRISHWKVLLTLTAVAAILLIWSQVGDPDFLTYLAGALAGFVSLILLSAAPVVGAFWLLERKLRK